MYIVISHSRSKLSRTVAFILKGLSREYFLMRSQDGLLDKQELLQWLIDLLEKHKNTDDSITKMLLSQVIRVNVKSCFSGVQNLLLWDATT